MAEGGQDYLSDNDSDVSLSVESDTGEVSDDDIDEFEDNPQFEDDEGHSDDEDAILQEMVPESSEGTAETEEAAKTDDQTDDKPQKPPFNFPKFMKFINEYFYGRKVTPQFVNIMTDFVDAEIFLIDGDSLLFELMGERSLDWNHGGQFLHLTYLLERFLQYFTDKGGVFHIVFFKDMEIIWASQPSMMLARQAIIMHLQYNASFTVVTSINNFWGKQWRDYVNDKIPAFLLLTDAENIPWETTPVKKRELEFFFRSLLCHSLGQGLNCVFISGIEMTATKVMGFYMESLANHKEFFRMYVELVWKTWNVVRIRYWRKKTSWDDHGASGTSPSRQIDLKEKVVTVLQSPPQGGCRELATLLASEVILCKMLNDPNASKETVKATEDKIKLFLLHSVLLKRLPLKYRAHTIKADNLLNRFCKAKDNQVYPFDEIHRCFGEILKTIQNEYPTMMAANHSLDMTSVADLMDGRLIHTLFCLMALDQRPEAFSMSNDVMKEAERAWGKVVVAVNTTQQHSDLLEVLFLPFLAGSSTTFRRVEEDSLESDTCVKLKQLLDVKNDLVNDYAGDIRSKINAMAGDEIEDEVFYAGREFDELYHWHSLKPLSDDYDRTKQDSPDKPPNDRKERFWYFKRKQQFTRFHRLYGDSLSGGVDQAKIITVTEPETKKKKGKSKEGKMSKKAAKIIEENKQKRKGQDQEKDQEKWTQKVEEIDKSLKGDNYSAALQLVDKFMADCKSPVFHLQALMKKAQSCFDAWQDTRSCDSNSLDMKYPVLLMESVQTIRDRFDGLLNDKDKKKLAGYMEKLGFDDISAIFYNLKAETVKKDGGLHSVNTTSARFQLEHMGHLLKRDERTDPDPRVDHFIPDTWQRHLLDAVDKNESAVIVAPTSSGKTYASYYCMERVLRESHDGVVVYVSPTKALVNQVAATMYARFHRKNLPEGRAVYGVFTRDYRYNTLNSQILVTVPQCLEILFLSPRRQDWTKKIKYVIFDEVHCLGQEIGAEVWEHLLLLIRCPFLALSATIGNPQDLLHWLQAAQDFRERQDKQGNGKLRKSYRIRLVTCEERYSDLEKSIYLPSPSNGEFSKETGQYKNYDVKSTEEFAGLHPCAQLGTRQLSENGFPSDMSLTPKETLQLYDVMVQHWPDKESLKGLSPEQYFHENNFIHKRHAKEYEEKLKKEFKCWADDKEFEKVQQVINSLNSGCSEKLTSTEEEWNKLRMSSSGKGFIWRNFPKFVEQLRAQDKLPALVFSFDRTFCEILAMDLAEEFQDREYVIRAGTRKLDEKKRSHAEKKVKRTRDKTTKENGKRSSTQRDKIGEAHDVLNFPKLNETLPECRLSLSHGIGKQFLRLHAEKKVKRTRDEAEKEKGKRWSTQRDQIEEAQDEQDLSKLDEPLPEFTLSFSHGIGKQRLETIMDRIWMLRSDNPFKCALRRGISFHHAGLNSKMRSVVEMLFREKYLQIVTATGTLALGIHMPCKTVVFAGDSPFLNSLMYRQMSGRAGRRGFDPVGNVVFFGVPYRKVQRLMTANIPKLVGNFPINVSLVSRLLLMTSTGDDKKDALTKALGLLSHPFICRKHPEMENQIKKHFLFSVELLARLGLINKDNGAPQEMAGLAIHLHYHEPSNFVLVRFLQRGLFHQLCQPGENGKFSEDVMRTMVLVLSHLFARTFLHASFKRRIHLCPSSKVILEDLPEEFAEALQDYNGQVTNVFSQYLATVAAEHEKERGEENKLPLSGIEFPNQASINLMDEHGIIKTLGRSAIIYSACSSFAALSGNSDLRLHSMVQPKPDEEEEMNKGNAEDVDSNAAENGARKRDGKSEDEKNDVECHREPIDHLLKIVRQDVYTDMHVVPILPLKKLDSFGRVQHLNAYALDFFKHGSKKCIEKENGIRSGEVFNALKDFYLTIRSISCSLEELGPETDNVVLAFKQLGEEFGEKFRKQYDYDI